MKWIANLETGISQEHLIPKDMSVLYIGAPTDLDIPTLEWIYGKYAGFMHIDTIFRKQLEVFSGQLITKMNVGMGESWMVEEEKILLTQIHDQLIQAYTNSQKIQNVKDFLNQANQWKKLLEELQQISSEAIIPFRSLATVVCTYAYRGFYDIGLWNTIIVPKLQIMRKEMLRQGIIYDQADENMASWEQVYLQQFRSTAERSNSNIHQILFPQIPYRDRSLDRIIASWSMSTHAFGNMEYEGFMICWNELKRVLKEKGEAYIFPLVMPTNADNFQQSLQDMKSQIQMSYRLLNTHGQEVSSFPDAYTMKIIKE